MLKIRISRIGFDILGPDLLIVHNTEGADLVLELPGWVQPAPVIVAIQAGRFELPTN